MTTTASTWALTGPEFLWLYGGLCALTGVWVWMMWRAAMRPQSADETTHDTPDIYEVAMLNGGAQRAITTAITQLHRNGVLRHGDGSQTLEVAGELAPAAHPLEHAVFEAVDSRAVMWVPQLRRELEEDDAIASMKSRLTDAGLLLDDASASRLRRLWLAGLVLLELGIGRIVVGTSHDARTDLLVVMLGAVAVATYKLARQRVTATARGRAIVKQRRAER